MTKHTQVKQTKWQRYLASYQDELDAQEAFLEAYLREKAFEEEENTLLTHLLKRCSQREISLSEVYEAMQYGESEPTKLNRVLHKWKKIAVISANGEAITCYPLVSMRGKFSSRSFSELLFRNLARRSF